MICATCGNEFEQLPRKRRTCSRSCAVALGWAEADPAARDARRAALGAGQKSRSAAISESNRRRWARPGEREKLSERNRQAWANPETRAHLTAMIRERTNTPAHRAQARKFRLACWRDPAYRARVTAAIGKSHRTQTYRDLFSAMLRARWADPEQRARYTAGIRRHTNTAEYRQAQRERMLARWAARRGAIVRPPLRPPARPITLTPIPKPNAAVVQLSPTRVREEEAMAAFLARRGVTRVPGHGDAAIADLPPLVFDRRTRKLTRRLDAEPPVYGRKR